MKRFVLTEEHIKLLRAMYVDWNQMEGGAPMINPKRPYGNGDVIGDINRILGEPPMEDHWRSFPANVEARYEQLHKDTETALQIVVATGSFLPGSYVVSDYDKDWRLSE